MLINSAARIDFSKVPKSVPDQTLRHFIAAALVPATAAVLSAGRGRRQIRHTAEADTSGGNDLGYRARALKLSGPVPAEH